MIVDASALIDLLVDAPAAGAVRERLFSRTAPWHAPVSIYAEVLHGLRRQWIAGILPEERGALAAKSLQATRLILHPVEPLIQRAYVALAERLELPLITRDYRLSRSSGHTARIEYIG